jgi:hypothetical protein
MRSGGRGWRGSNAADAGRVRRAHGPPIDDVAMTADGALAERIGARAEELARRSTERMYEDPFWEARFGARGRRFAEEDGRHHVDHLVLALLAGDAAPLAEYASWLRVVLTTRGMSSRHIEQNFARLRQAIDDVGVEDAARAHEFLDAAARAVRPEGTGALALFDARGALAVAARRRFEGEHAAWVVAGDADTPGSTDDEIATLASFLVDAVALGRPDVLGKHAAWAAAFDSGRGRPSGYVAALLDAMEHVLAEAVPDEGARRAAAPVITAARQGLP